MAALAVALTALAACETTETRQVARSADPRDPRRDASQTRVEPRPSDAATRAQQADAELKRRAQIRLELASAHYQQANYPQALEELRAALAIDPDNVAALGLMGLVQMDLGERAQAEESFQRALRIAPNDSDLLNNYGWFLCQTGRAREAIPQFQAALSNPLYSTPARALHNAGICSLRFGDEAGAEAYFTRAFQIDARNPVAMYNLGEIYLKRGDIERARFHSRRLIEFYPPTAETLWLALRVERKAGDRDAVASLGAQLRRQFPSSREANLLQRGAFGV
jgi:type IV pilus assembly protein PilF